MYVFAMKHLLKTLFYTVVRHYNFSGAVVLMYHSISHNGEFFSVTPMAFEQQMHYLRQMHFTVLSFDEFFARLQARKDLSRAVVLTFDDGYEDNFTTAFPILQRYGLPATIFVNTSLIGNVATRKSGLRMPILSWDMMLQMVRGGLITFGSHCHTHEKLTTLSHDRVEFVVRTSQHILEERLGVSPRFFAYPYGVYDDVVLSIVKRYFDGAVCVRPGRVTLKTSFLRIPRNAIDSAVTPVHFQGIVHYGRIS